MTVAEGTHDITLSCFSCAHPHEPERLQNVCLNCGRPLRVDVALPSRDSLVDESVDSMWRYQRALPFELEEAVTLGEGWSPVRQVSPNTWVKDESGNPTGSFKDRGMSMAVTAARLLGAKRLVVPSAGNAAVSLARYGAEASVPVTVAMPDDTPGMLVTRCRVLGAEVQLVPGDISTAGAWLSAHRAPGDFDVSTLKEPYRVEGKKTMGYEIWEQFPDGLPDVVVYPTGGGTGLIGMWKAWDELEEIGAIDSKRPRLVSVQSTGCAPIVEAHRRRAADTEPWVDPSTRAWGLRVPHPIGGFICLRALSETGGDALAIDEADIHSAAWEASVQTGIDFCPEGGAAWAAATRLRELGDVGADESVLVWNTGAGEGYREPG